jgi:hypothetical protein
VVQVDQLTLAEMAVAIAKSYGAACIPYFVERAVLPLVLAARKVWLRRQTSPVDPESDLSVSFSMDLHPRPSPLYSFTISSTLNMDPN